MITFTVRCLSTKRGEILLISICDPNLETPDLSSGPCCGVALLGFLLPRSYTGVYATLKYSKSSLETIPVRLTHGEDLTFLKHQEQERIAIAPCLPTVKSSRSTSKAPAMSLDQLSEQ